MRARSTAHGNAQPGRTSPGRRSAQSLVAIAAAGRAAGSSTVFLGHLTTGGRALRYENRSPCSGIPRVYAMHTPRNRQQQSISPRDADSHIGRRTPPTAARAEPGRGMTAILAGEEKCDERVTDSTRRAVLGSRPCCAGRRSRAAAAGRRSRQPRRRGAAPATPSCPTSSWPSS